MYLQTKYRSNETQALLTACCEVYDGIDLPSSDPNCVQDGTNWIRPVRKQFVGMLYWCNKK